MNWGMDGDLSMRVSRRDFTCLVISSAELNIGVWLCWRVRFIWMSLERHKWTSLYRSWRCWVSSRFRKRWTVIRQADRTVALFKTTSQVLILLLELSDSLLRDTIVKDKEEDMADIITDVNMMQRFNNL